MGVAQSAKSGGSLNTDLSARYGARYKAILVNDEEEEEEEGNVGQERDLPIGRADVYLPGTSEAPRLRMRPTTPPFAVA